MGRSLLVLGGLAVLGSWGAGCVRFSLTRGGDAAIDGAAADGSVDTMDDGTADAPQDGAAHESGPSDGAVVEGVASPDTAQPDTAPPDAQATDLAVIGPDLLSLDLPAVVPDQAWPDLPAVVPDQAWPDLPAVADQAWPDLPAVVPDQAWPDLPLPDLIPAPDSSGPVVGPAFALGGPGDDRGMVTAVDAAGNLYLAGRFSGTVNVGGNTLVSNGGTDILLASFTAAGVHRWSRGDGGPSDDGAQGLAIDHNGNLHLTGYFAGQATIAGQSFSSAGNNDIFLASFTAAGAPRWSQAFGVNWDERGADVVVDGGNNLHLVGTGGTGIDLGGGAMTANSLVDVLVASFTADGGYLQAFLVGSSKADSGQSIAVDASGAIYVTGSTLDAGEFGGPTLPFAGASDIFLACYSASGVHQWSKAFGSTGFDGGNDLAVDNNGSLYLTGYFSDQISFGGKGFTSAGGYDVFVASFSTNGKHNWSEPIGSPLDDIGIGVAVDASGDLYVAGYIGGTASIAATTLTSAGDTDAFAASFTSAGGYRWSASYGGPLADAAYELALGGAALPDTLFVIGFFNGSATFGAQVLTSEGLGDIFVLKRSQN